MRKTEIEALKRQIENTQLELTQLDAALASFYKSGSKTLDAEKRAAKEKSLRVKINNANQMLQVSEANNARNVSELSTPIQAGEIMRVQPPAPDVAPENDANGEQDGEGSNGGEKLDPDMLTARAKRGWRERENALKLFRAGLSMAIPAKTVDVATTEKLVYANEVVKAPEDVSDPKGKGKRVATEAFDEGEAPNKAAKTESSSEKKGKKPVKVLMLSARDSVSGLNLTEASHCIILHPFYSHNDEHAIGSEKQGVARVLRKGQEKTVKIVRFYVENTVEQGIHDTRMRGHEAEE
ncbi:hypothetical protein CcCBS67573_g09848 [Chytriomyces confervae]|uniref:Helicase C-terminal domain-containing protein n=1 Tax=Chytriomyces confervae TaxID=246404 RepID=A0A507DMA7_9FUNG|nr:hypothetical protein CcCBS67573_g09848 [Chytriomyces confervae]